MKVALFTYFASSSYGATLQTYATLKMLKELGHEVSLVNYIIPEPPRSFIIDILLILKMKRLKNFRKKYYDNFLTIPYKSFDDLRNNPPKADFYMIGSDQTWNPEISREKTLGYFLAFGDDKVKRVTYAASFGKSKWNDTEWLNKADAKKLLQRFDNILIREQSGCELLKNEFGIDSVQVLDPVFLFPKYPELTRNIKNNGEIITFKLQDSPLFYEKMTVLSEKLGTPARILGSLRKKKGFRSSYPEGIEDWLCALAGARFVVTDSFHGLVISILYHRPFLACMAIPERFARLKDLLEMLGLEDRIFSINDDAESIICRMQKPIDWNRVDSILQKQREKSINLLKAELS